MLNRFYLWAYFLVITTYLVITHDMEMAKMSDDPSAGAIFGFLPYLIPLYCFVTAKFLAIPYVISEIWIYLTTYQEPLKHKEEK